MNFIKKIFGNAQGKYFQLAKDTIIYGVGNALSKFLIIFLTPLLTSYFLPSEFGSIDLIVSTVSLSAVFISLNLESSLQRYFYEAKAAEEKDVLFSSIINFILIFSAVFNIIVFLLKDSISQLLFEQTGYGILIFLASLSVVLQLILSLKFQIYRLENKSVRFILFTSLVIVFQFLFVIIFLFSLNWGLYGYFYAIVLSNALMIFIIILFEFRNYKLTIQKNLLRKCLKFAIPGIPSVLITGFILVVPRYLLIYFSGLTEVGFYAFALKLCAILTFFIFSFQMAWYPYSLKIIQQEDAKSIYAKVYRYSFLFFICLSAVLIFCSNLLLDLLGNQEYAGSIIYFQLLLCATIIGFQLHFLHLPFTIIEKPIFISYSQIINLTVLIASGILFTYFYGGIGAMIALIISSASGIFYLFYASRSRYFINFNIGRVSVSVLVLLAFILLYNVLPLQNIFAIVLTAIAFFAVQILLLTNKGELFLFYNKFKQA